jgi:AraC-like DNA-binding protein
MPAEYVPTDAHRALVESASAFGITQAEIATQLKISEPTLRKHFRDELDGGAFKANMKVGGNMYGLTQSADEQVRLRACQWWTSRRMGWKETSVNEQVGKDGGPIETKDVSAIDIIRARIASASARLGEKEDSREPETER